MQHPDSTRQRTLQPSAARLVSVATVRTTAGEATSKLATGHPPVFGRMSPAHGPAGEATGELS